MDRQRAVGTTNEESENELKLTLPGMRSKVKIAPPQLDRLESFVTSPCVSDATLTSRRLREMIPCTPSPMYSYDVQFGAGMFDASGRVVPRFFPFPIQGMSPDTMMHPGMSSETKPERQISPRSIGSSTNHHSGSPSFTVSPNGITTPITTPIGENSTLADEPAVPRKLTDVTALLVSIKQAVQSNGGFDLTTALKTISVQAVVDDAVELSKDQLGSRFLQHLLDSDRLGVSLRRDLVSRVLPEAKELTVDPFGNYVVQKVIDFATDDEAKQLLSQLKGGIFNLSIHMYGCRVVQKILERSDLDSQLVVAREMSGHVLQCVEDQNGNHVIQKLIEKLPPEHLSFIVGEFLGHISVMAIHCYGCRVVQRLLEKLKPADSSLLVGEILSNLWQLSQDQYGNYVVQHVLTHGTAHSRSVILQVIASHIVEFSCHKYASNIAEKALLCSDDQASRDLLIGAVIGSGGLDSPLHILMKDRFANYVIQRCIEFSHGTQREILIDILRANLPTLKKVIYGKHIATAIERILH